MNDAKLAELAEQFSEADAEMKNAKERKDKLGERICSEMERRDTRGIKTHGLQITYVKQEPLVYNEARLLRVLGDRAPQVFCKLDKDQLAAVVLSPETNNALRVKIERCATPDLTRKPYVLVNEDKG